MERLQFLGIVLFIYGVLSASAITRAARMALTGEHLEPLRHIERLTVTNYLGPALPLVAGLAIVSFSSRYAVAVMIAATLCTVALLVARGLTHARRMSAAGVPPSYLASYRKAYAIRMASLAVCAVALMYPALQGA